MPSDLNDPVINFACMLGKSFCDLIQELLWLESGTIVLRYSNLHDTIVLQQGLV